VDADRVWNEFGVNGAGAVVGDFDTGVQWDHPALKSQYRGWNGVTVDHNYNWFEPDSNLYPGGNLGPSVSSVPIWCNDHGIHTMGTMVGDGGTANTKIGMAPGAKWIAVPGICGNTMPGYWGDDIGGNKAFQWFLCPTDLSGDLSTRDCSKAPDVVNNSWGSSNPADDTFRPAIQALRAAGIVPVFAAGNPSAGPGSIGSPASVPEAFTIGATDIDDKVASFSGRGPSFYEEVQKPNVTAPGVNIKSSVSGNGYQSGWSGTSMAAPAVSGLVALMVSADLKDGRRDFNADEIQKFIESTAVKFGTTTPNDDYGYGRIDAYNAVRWVLSAGDLRGTVRNANTSAPINGATITGVKALDTFTTASAANGAYSVTVPGGSYNVTVNAFGYNPGTFAGVSVLTGTSSVVDFNLTPLPAATLTGVVLSGTTPVNGALVYVDAKPSLSFTTGASGVYTLTLPTGAQALTVKAKGYRIQHENVTVASGGSTHNFVLTPAPTILLVEADNYYGWFGARPAHNFFQVSLDQRNYLYDTTAITDSASFAWLTTVMTPTNYGVVIWIDTGYSPDFYGSTPVLQNYLDSGGRLIISGQNIAFFDGSTTFFQNYLHATYSMGVAAGRGDKVSGLSFLNTLDLTLNEAALYSYDNTAISLSPDAVAPRDGSAYPVMTYNNGNGAAALAVEPCGAGYRAVYFAVGYENLGPRAYNRPPEYADVLDRSIQWVIGSKAAYGVDAFVSPNSKVLPPGSVFTYGLLVANRGVNTDTYNLSLAGNVWPTRIVSGTTQVAQTVQLAACSQQVLGVEVTIPNTASMGAIDTFTVTATSQAQLTTNSRMSAKTTAFPLWEVEAPMPTPRYRLGATALPGTPYYFAIGGQGISGSLAANERYNACSNTWTSMAPLPAVRGNINAAVLNGKIYVVGGYASGTAFKSVYMYSPTTDTWSSVADLPVALTGVAIAAANGKLYALGGADATGNFYRFTYEYDPATNVWTTKAPMPGDARGYAAAAELGGKIYVVGGWPNLATVEVYDPTTDTWSTAASMNFGRQSPGLTAAADGYLYVSGGGNGWNGLTSAERYNPATNTWTIIPSLNNVDRAGSASAFVAGRVFAVGGASYNLSNVNESLKLADAFCLSNKQVQQITVQPGDRITYTIELHSNPTALANASVRDPIPAGTTFGGFGYNPLGATYNSGQNRVEWTGAIPGGQVPVTFTFGVVVNPTGWTSGQRLTNTATFSDGVSLAFNKVVVSILNFFDLTPATKIVNQTVATAGAVLTYTIQLTNASNEGGSVILSDLLPANTTYIPDSLTYTIGSGAYTSGVITWTGGMPAILIRPMSSYDYGDSAGGGTVPGVTFDWQDMTGATDTGVDADDGIYGVFPIGFTFRFYDNDYSQFYVSPNGWVGFSVSGGSIVSCGSYGNAGAPNNFIGGFGGDRAVYTADGGAITYKVFGIAPNRYLVVQFTHMRYYYSTPDDYLDMQIILYEGTHEIVVQYQNLTTAPTTAAFGLEGTVPDFPYVFYGDICQAFNITDMLAVKFRPNIVFVPTTVNAAALTFAVTTAALLPANTWITNTATFTDSRNVVYQRSAGTLINNVNLSASTKLVDRSQAAVGDPVNYHVVLRNTGLYTATGASLSDPIPSNTTWNGVAPTCTSGTCGYAAGVVTWTGAIAPGALVTVSLGVTYTTPLVDLTPVTNTATINDGLGELLTRRAVFRARKSNLSTTYKTVNSTVAKPGQVVTYTIYLYNSGGVDGNAQLVDSIPAGLTYVPGSLLSGSGTGSYASGTITWTGSVPAASQIPVQFRATVSALAAEGTVIVNTATITDVTWSTSYQRAVVLTVRRFTHQIYLPLVLRQ